MAKDEVKTKVKAKFTKEDLMKSKIFCDKRDVLCAVIKNGESVTVDEAEERINKFMRKEVK